jgi:hypothetical protein
VILLKQAFGVLPELSTKSVRAHLVGYQSIAVGWLLHFFVGVCRWGPLYAWIDPQSSFPHGFKGMTFGTGVWLGVTLLILPAVGAGVFGLQFGIVTPAATLVLHGNYGTV